MQLRSSDATVEIDPLAGGRVVQVEVGGRALLVDDHSAGPMGYGCYPMVPWAGRIDQATFSWRGEAIELDPLDPPHAIHGVGLHQPWDVRSATSDRAELACVLDWPLGGHARQRFAVTDGGLRLELSVTATRTMPVTIGWHPWFARPVDLRASFAAMYERGPDHLPTGRLVRPTEPPWDDCFVLPHHLPVLRFEHCAVTIDSDCTHWVVFTERDHAVCVEPMSGPPNAIHLDCATTLAAGETLTRWMTWQWS